MDEVCVLGGSLFKVDACALVVLDCVALESGDRLLHLSELSVHLLYTLLLSLSPLLLLELRRQHIDLVQLLKIFDELLLLLHSHRQEHVPSEIEDSLLSILRQLLLLFQISLQLDDLILQLVQMPHEVIHILQLFLELPLQHQ